MSCLDNIISVPDGCGNDTESLSGYSVFDLAGITLKNSAQAATEKFVSGINLFKDCRRRALMSLRNDFLTYLQANGYVPKISTPVWSTKERSDGSIKAATNVGDYRGIVVKKQKKCAGIERLFISKVYVKVDYTGTLVLRIEDGELSYPYNIEVQAGVVAPINVNFMAETAEVHILLPDSVAAYSVLPNCQCSGTQKKSSCAKVIGYYNGIETKGEGFGIWADVSCKCNYELILCQLATDGLLGEAALYKTGVAIMDEAIKGDRLNYFTVYAKEQNEATLKEYEAKYAELWNTLIMALPTYLKSVDNCGCIECGSYRRANV